MAESSDTDETIENLHAGLTYVISVSALDEVGNESTGSDTIHVTTLNDDFTTFPSLPEVHIVDFRYNASNPGTVSEMTSLGFAELDAYGIMVTQDNQLVEEGYPIFAETSQTEVENKGRVSEGLQLLYNFTEIDGYSVSDISGVGESIDLHINKPLNTVWLPGQGLKIIGNTTLISEGSPIRLIESLASSNELTIEAWISQSEKQQAGPARIVTLSDGTKSRAFTLGHEGNDASYHYVARLNTTDTDINGLPGLATSAEFHSQSLHHVVYTRDKKGNEKMYVNGIELSSGVREGDFSSWTGNYKLALGNEINGERPWEGIFYLVAIYNKLWTKLM